MAVFLSPVGGVAAQFFTNNGVILSGGKLYTYAAGTTTNQTTYTSSSGVTAHTNPIILDSAGRVPGGETWVTNGVSYKFVLKDSNDVLIATYDNLYGLANSSIDSADVAYNPPFASSVATTVEDKLAQTISVKDFGAVGDFNPATGTGTDDRAAIQAALNYATSINNCQVVFPAGNYYLGTGLTVSTSGLKAQLLLGSLSTADAVSMVILQGEGATIYQGAPGTALAIANASNILVSNLKMVGYAGGTLNSSREFDNLIGIFLSSKFISIDGCYITNSLGYTVYTVGNPNVAEGGTTETCLNITIRNSTLKMRYGNGATPNSGGSKSLWAFAAVDAQNVVIQDNVIYGNLDFEPNNLVGQSSYGIFVEGNQFPAGYVTPILPTGPTNYWLDEEIGKSNSGGTAIVGSVSIVGATGAPLNACNVVSNNSFDQGIINVGAAVYYQWVLNNSFRLGKINVGSTSGGNTNRYYTINGNSTYQVIDATSAFIVFGGNVSGSHFSDNVLTNQDIPVIGWDGVGGADGGTNNYSSNTSPVCVTNPVINFPGGFAATSVLDNNTGGGNEIVAFTTSLTDGTNAATLTGNALYYKTQGRLITFSTRLFITSAGTLGAAGASYITLPSASRATPSDTITAVQLSIVQNTTVAAGTFQVYGYIDAGSDKCYLYIANASGAITSFAAANFTSNAVIIVSGSYFTA